MQLVETTYALCLNIKSYHIISYIFLNLKTLITCLFTYFKNSNNILAKLILYYSFKKLPRIVIQKGEEHTCCYCNNSIFAVLKLPLFPIFYDYTDQPCSMFLKTCFQKGLGDEILRPLTRVLSFHFHICI